MNANPYEAPKSEIALFSEGAYSDQEVEDISQFFNMLVIFFSANFLCGLSHALIFSLLTTFAYVGTTYYLVKHCRVPRPWLYVILAFIPFVSLISLIVVIRRASAILKENGYKIGLLGSKKAET